MALVNCKECGQEISDTAKKCPHCGFKQKKNIKLTKKNWLFMIITIIIVSAIILAMMINGYKSNEEEKKKNIDAEVEREMQEFRNETFKNPKGSLGQPAY